MKLAEPKLSPASINRLIIAGLVTVGIDSAIFHFLYRQPGALASAHMSSFLVAAIFGYLAVALWPAAGEDKQCKLKHFDLGHLVTFAAIALLVMFLRGGLLASLMQILAVPAAAAMAVCAIFSSLLFFGAYFYFIYPCRVDGLPSETKKDYFFIAILGYTVLLRLFYLGVPDLIFEEAYYWNYAQHLDIGYLDHPLAVAWIIKLFTSLMGNIEFAVRFGAFLCWFVTAYFSYRLAREVVNEACAKWALILVAVLPAYFSFSWFMTPDVPLAALWVTAIYYMHQAIVREDKRAWLGVGIAIGLGMISKYTIALIAAALLLFVVADKRSRKWLFRPEPYVAVAITCILFTPVIVWNVQHEWASILFQSQHRISSGYSFSLPRFINNVLIMITPTGVLSVIAIIIFRKALLSAADTVNRDSQGSLERSYLLLAWLALFPVIVFAVLSLFRESKLNWTGPSWLGLLPFIALLITSKLASGAPKLLAWSQRAWPPTVVILLLIYGAGFHYLGLGLPMAPYPKNSHLIGWQDFGRDIEVLVTQHERETGEQVLVVGMDKIKIASGLAFYRAKYIGSSNEKVSHDPAFQTSTAHLFGRNGLMYEFWFPIEEQDNKTMLLVSSNIGALTSNEVASRVKSMGEIKEIKTWRNGKQTGRYYYRLVNGYKGKSESSSLPVVDSED